MAGGCVGERSRCRINQREGGGHIRQFESSAQRAVHARQYETRISDFPFLDRQSDLDHRGHNRCRHTVARDVSDEHT